MIAMSLETKVQVVCEWCATKLSVPRGYSGKILCVKCRKELYVNAEMSDAELIATRLDSIEHAIKGVSSTIWVVFFVIPMIFTLVWLMILFT